MVPSLELTWADFAAGAELAVSTVHERLAENDLEGLKELVTSNLIEARRICFI